MRFALVLMILFVFKVAAAQEMINFKSIDFQPLRVINYTEFIGSPYFLEKDKYRPGKVKISNSQIYENDIKLLYNQLTDEVTFCYKEGEKMSFKTRPMSFSIISFDDDEKKESQFISNIATPSDPKGLAYYQILVNGKSKLLKRTSKTVSERKGYSDATVKSVIGSNSNYFVLTSLERLIKINSNKDFLQFCPEVESFVMMR